MTAIKKRKPVVPKRTSSTTTAPETSATSTAPATPAPTARPKRKPIVAPAVKKAPPAKEVKPDVPKTEPKQEAVESQPGARAEVEKVIIAGKRTSPPTEPRPAPTRKGADDFEEERDRRQISLDAMKAMSIEDRHKLFRELNKDTASEIFMTVRKELPKQLVMRKDEAILRGLIKPEAPRVKSLKVYYCGYCVDYMPFTSHSFTGYTKCCGCSISTRDFYIRADNQLFNAD